MPGHNLPSRQAQYLNSFLFCNIACLQETWTGNEKIADGQEKAVGEEEQDQEEEEEMTDSPSHPKHDPEDL